MFRLDIVLNATELQTGTAFRFGSSESGGWQFGTLRDNAVPVAEAVAASAAYPTMLPAVDRRYKFISKSGEESERRVVLADGGIYDNLATSAIEPGRDSTLSSNVFAPRIVISSDAGTGGDVESPPYLWPERVVATASAMHSRNQNLTRARLFQYEESGELVAIVTALLGMRDERIPYAPSDLVPKHLVAAYPTDFSPMKQRDIDLISRRGEQIMTQLVAFYLHDK